MKHFMYALTAFSFCMITLIYSQQSAASKINVHLQSGIYANLITNKGKIILELDYKHVPMTVANFVGLAEGKIKNDAFPLGTSYFNGSIWHRVVPGHVIQAGMPVSKDTLEGPGYEFPNEIYSGLSHNKAGMLGMANAGPNTNGSQFYITLGNRSYLDGNYTLFGEVVDGMDVVFKIVQGDTIKSIAITRIGKDANEFQVTDELFRKIVEEAKAKLKIEEENKQKEEERIIKENWPGALTLHNNVRYVITNEGSGDKPKVGTVLKVIYTGKTLLKNLTFVSSSDQGKPTNYISEAEPFEFTIGKSKINPGIDESITDMRPGEKRIVIVPSNNAYGISAFYAKMIEGRKRFVISPNSTLVYQIEIFK